MLRVLREWVLARPAPASPLARACALRLLCRVPGLVEEGAGSSRVNAHVNVCMAHLLICMPMLCTGQLTASTWLALHSSAN